MRPELREIVRVELYIDGKLTGETKKQFESQLERDQELQELHESVQLLRSAAYRAGLRKQIEQLQSKGPNWGKIGGGTLILALVVALSYWFYPSQEIPSIITYIDDSTFVTEKAPINMTESVLTLFDTPEEDVITPAGELPPIELEESFIEPDPTSHFPFELGGLKMWASPEIQNFKFQASEGATIEGKQGTLIIVPENAFIDVNGNTVNGNIQLELVEAFNPSEFILHRLKTVSNGDPLSSGGMFYIQAKSEGKEVAINPKRPLYIEVPALDTKPNMMAFAGEPDSSGNINWVDPQPLKKYLAQVDLASLDFLPTRFEPEVSARLPFRGIPRTKSSIDSLYYMLYMNDLTGNKGKRRIMPKVLGLSLDKIGTVPDDERLIVEATMDSAAEEIYEYSYTDDMGDMSFFCGIYPTTVQTLKTKQFNSTYVSTREFQERIKALHEFDNGEELLAIYLDNLKKDMHWADSVVARRLEGDAQRKFLQFASLRHSNIEYPKIYQKRLSDYYRKKREQLNQRNKKLQANIQKRNAKELKTIVDDLESSNNRFLNRYTRNFPTPNAATSNTYSFTWYKSGWANIDAYLKLINNRSKKVQIAIEGYQPQVEVSQWLQEVNTHVDLSVVGKKATAVFPAKPKGSSNTYAFGMNYLPENESYLWGFTKYNPYTVEQVSLQLAPTDLEEIKSTLKSLDVEWGTIKKQMDWKKKQMEDAIKWKLKMEEERQKWLKEQKVIMEEYRKAKQKQQEEQRFKEVMYDAALPCFEIRRDTVVTSEQVEGDYIGPESRWDN